MGDKDDKGVRRGNRRSSWAVSKPLSQKASAAATGDRMLYVSGCNLEMLWLKLKCILNLRVFLLVFEKKNQKGDKNCAQSAKMVSEGMLKVLIR